MATATGPKTPRRKRERERATKEQAAENAIAVQIQRSLLPCMPFDIVDLICDSLTPSYEYKWVARPDVFQISADEKTITCKKSKGAEPTYFVGLAAPSFSISPSSDKTMDWIVRCPIPEHHSLVFVGIADPSKTYRVTDDFFDEDWIAWSVRKSEEYPSEARISMSMWTDLGAIKYPKTISVDVEKFQTLGVRFSVDHKSKTICMSVGSEVRSIDFSVIPKDWSSVAPFVGLSRNSQATIGTLVPS